MQILLDVVRPGASIADVSFLVKYLNKQIQDTKKWLGMLKTHVLIHRLLHESGDEFKSQMKKAQRWTAEDRDRDSRLKCMFSIRNWKDDNGVDASELSGWTRCYARYLEEYVEALDDIPPLGKSMGGRGGGSSRARDRSRSRDRDDRGYGRDRDRGSFDRDRDRGYGRDPRSRPRVRSRPRSQPIPAETLRRRRRRRAPVGARRRHRDPDDDSSKLRRDGAHGKAPDRPELDATSAGLRGD